MAASLIGPIEVTSGLKEGGTVLVNTGKSIAYIRDKLPDDCRCGVAVVDATEISLKYGLGSKESPIVNTAILGAFSKATGIVKIESVLKAIEEKVPAKVEANKKAAFEAYESTKTDGEVN